MWEVWYSLEAATYLEDNGVLVADLFFAMESLADSDGMPAIGDCRQIDELTLWQVVGHLVIYQRFETERIVQVTAIKPN